MQLQQLRRFAGGAVAAAILIGCSSRSPLSDLDGAPGRSPRWSPTEADPSAGAPSANQRRVDQRLPELSPHSTLEDYRRYAALSNAGLEAMFQDWQAALERVPQAGALQDPRFTYGYYISSVETRLGPMQHSISISQMFPWVGKLQDREDAATRGANAAYQRFEAARFDLSLRVEKAYNELYFLKRSIDITNDNIELLGQFERVARARYQVAAAGHPAMIRIQVELGALEDRLRRLRDLSAPLVAKLNAALNRRPDADVPWPTAVSSRVADADRQLLIDAMRRRNPELRALQEEIERERIEAEIARKDALPDLTVGLSYTEVGPRTDAVVPGSGDDAVLATLSINLPIWRDKYEAATREALARRLAAAARHDDAVSRLSSELEHALFEHQDARRRVELYLDTLIPKATQSIQATLGGFQQGQSDFLDLIDTERTLLEFQLALERALADRATSYANIERLVGASLSDLTAAPTTEGDAP